LDEVFVKINGVQKYLWRAVDQDGNVLDILLQNRRDGAAARRFLRKLLKKTRSVPRVVVTDKLRSYGAAHRTVMPSVEHRSHKGMNNRAENSHQPTRQRERPRRNSRPPPHRERLRERLVLEQWTQRLADPDRQRALRERGPHHPRGQLRHPDIAPRLQRHPTPRSTTSRS
jgi:IS1 family transposase